MSQQPDTVQAATRVRRAVLLGLFAGTGVGAGYLLSGVPGCELVTLVAVLAGGVLGRGLGGMSGVLSAGIFSLGNPFGPPVPLVLAAQCCGMGLAGWLGGAAGGMVLTSWRSGRRRRAAVLSMVLGLLATLIYDLLTNSAMAVAFDLPLGAVLLAGAPFALLHLATNGVQFVLVFPALLARFAGRAALPLRGSVRALLIVICGATAISARATVAPPSASAATADSLGHWEPFLAHFAERLSRETFFLALPDGGFGSRLVVVHEAGTSPVPLVLRDGVPLGTGHRWTDDPGLVNQTGLELAECAYAMDGWGGSSGLIALRGAETNPSAAVTDTRFYKGAHGTYLRSLAFRTPRAPWRLRFDFEESIDQEGFDFRPPGDARFSGLSALGEARFRSGRAQLCRLQPDGDGLSLSLETQRKHKTGLPAHDLRHEEVWSDHAAITWRGRSGAGHLRTSLFVAGADVQREWLDLGTAEFGKRKLEMTREGVVVEWTGDESGRRLTSSLLNWRLADSGPGQAWAGAWRDTVRAEGQQASFVAAMPLFASGVAGMATLSAWWDDYGGWLPGGELAVRPASGLAWCELSLAALGRAPRPDELWTVDRVTDGSRTLILLPNPDLRREQTLRAAMRLSRSLGGTDFAVDASARRLRDGIGWLPFADRADSGRWGNDLALDSWSLVVSAERAGRVAGWARLRGDAAWRGHNVRHGVAVGLPPSRSCRLGVEWERVVFGGDGVCEIGYMLEHRGEMGDPWLPGGLPTLPAHTFHHLLLGFRLVGVDLTLELRNLTDAQPRLSAGALGDGREMRWRLHWKFSH